MSSADLSNYGKGNGVRAARLLAEGELIGPVGGFAKTLFIVAGPWLISVFALAVMSASLELIMGRAATEDLRLAIIYSLCVAPLSGGPIGTICAQQIRMVIDQGAPELVPNIFLAGLVLSGGVTMVLAIGLCAMIGLPSDGVGVAFIFLSVVTALLWCCLSALSAIQDYRYLLFSFAAGMLHCALASMMSVGTELNVTRLIWAFSSGLVLFVAMSIARIAPRSSSNDAEFLESLFDLLHSLNHQKYLALGILLAFLGVWVDKWVLWAGPYGQVSLSGFAHYGSYDSVMFLAHLSIIPTFVLMHRMQEGTVANAMRDFRTTLNSKSSLATLMASVNSLREKVWNRVFEIIFVQSAITAALVLLVPIISQLMQFDLVQFLMLRVSLVAVFVHAIFHLSSAILVICGRSRLFFLVQLTFFVANLSLTAILTTLYGPSSLGLFTAALLAATMAFHFAYLSLKRYSYFALIGENDSLFRRPS